MLSIIDISKDKDFEFFVRIGQALSDFTVKFNVSWSDLAYILRLQGYSLGVLTGDPNLKPESMTIGPNKLLFLPKNPSNPDSSLSIDFKNPSPDIDAHLKTLEALVATFLTTRGADAKSIQASNSGSASYSSAIERLLAMIEHFEATKEDFDLFNVVEKHLHKIVTAWLAVLTGNSEMLDPEYNVTSGIVNSRLSVQFHKPEMIETKSEQLDNAQKKVDLGIADQVSILADLEHISIEEAQIQIDEIQSRRRLRLQSLQNESVENGDNQDQP